MAGVWKCQVDDNSATGQSSIFWADMQLYVANGSEVRVKYTKITFANLINMHGDSEMIFFGIFEHCCIFYL
jgi:hypothetical protein